MNEHEVPLRDYVDALLRELRESIARRFEAVHESLGRAEQANERRYTELHGQLEDLRARLNSMYAVDTTTQQIMQNRQLWKQWVIGIVLLVVLPILTAVFEHFVF